MSAIRKTQTAAKSSDLIGGPPPEEQVPAAWRRPYDRLLKLRRSLLSEANDLEKDARDESPSFSMHMADAGTDSFDRDLALSLLAAEQDALAQIDAALQRIQDGTYGVCEKTGKPIPAERLAAVPWARFTVEVKAKMERSQPTPHAHLNPLASARPEKTNPPE